jgi:sulfur transfer protein SufE
MNLKIVTILICIVFFKINDVTAQEIQYKSSKDAFFTQLTEIWKPAKVTIQSQELKFKKKTKVYLVVTVTSDREIAGETFSDLVSSTSTLIFDGIANLGVFQGAQVDLKNTKSKEEKSRLIFETIDRSPILKGCKKSLSKKELKKCFSKMVVKHIQKNFDPSKFDDIGLEKKKYQIATTFSVSKKGKIVDVVVRHDNEVVQETITELIRSIKVRKPGYNNGEPIIVSYTIPIVFDVK